MAVTITKQPQAYTPSDNPIYYEFSSDQTGQDNFSFILKVFVNGIVVSNRQVYPTIGTSAYYDAVNEGRNYTSVPTLEIGAGVFQDADNNAEIYIEIYERYGSTPVTQALGATSSTSVVWKSKIDTVDFSSYNVSDVSETFITSSNFQRKLGDTEVLFLMVLNKGVSFDLTIKTYDSVGTVTAIATLTRTTTEEFTLLNLSANSLSEETIINLLFASYFTVECSNGLNIAPYRIDMDRECVQESSKRLHWIGYLGSPESFTLSLVSKGESTIDSFGYKRQYNNRVGNPNYFGRDLTTIKRRERKLMCNSNWLSNEEHIYLMEDLVFSPVVFFENGGDFTRVKSLNTATEEKRRATDMVFKETIEIGLGTDTSYLG